MTEMRETEYRLTYEYEDFGVLRSCQDTYYCWGSMLSNIAHMVIDTDVYIAFKVLKVQVLGPIVQEISIDQLVQEISIDQLELDLYITKIRDIYLEHEFYDDGYGVKNERTRSG